MINIEAYGEEIREHYNKYKDSCDSEEEATMTSICEIAHEFCGLEYDKPIMEWIYAKSDRLLAYDEEEYLYNVIEPFWNEVDYILKRDGYLHIGYKNGRKGIDLLLKKYKFDMLEENERYYLKDIRELAEKHGGEWNA